MRRDGRETRRLDAEKLVELTRKSIVDDADEVPLDEIDEVGDDPEVEWGDLAVAAAGSNETHPTLPTHPRTTTVCDPLTTAMLAEVARRAATVELDPDTVEVARRSTKEIDPEALRAALRDSEDKSEDKAAREGSNDRSNDNPFDAPTLRRK